MFNNSSKGDLTAGCGNSTAQNTQVEVEVRDFLHFLAPSVHNSNLIFTPLEKKVKEKLGINSLDDMCYPQEEEDIENLAKAREELGLSWEEFYEVKDNIYNKYIVFECIKFELEEFGEKKIPEKFSALYKECEEIVRKEVFEKNPELFKEYICPF